MVATTRPRRLSSPLHVVQHPPEPTMLTAEQVAERLGMSLWTVRQLYRSGALPGVLIGSKRYRFHRDVVERYALGQQASAAVGSAEERLAQVEAEMERVKLAIVAAMAAWQRAMGGSA